MGALKLRVNFIRNIMASAASGVNHCYYSVEFILVLGVSGSTRTRSIGGLSTNELAHSLACSESFPGPSIIYSTFK